MTNNDTEYVAVEILLLARPIESSLQKTFIGRSHTEIARHIAKDHGWLMFGDLILDTNGFIIAETLESAAAGMLALQWFEASGIDINWHVFGPTKPANAGTLRTTISRHQLNEILDPFAP